MSDLSSAGVVDEYLPKAENIMKTTNQEKSNICRIFSETNMVKLCDRYQGILNNVEYILQMWEKCKVPVGCWGKKLKKVL